MNSDPLVNRVRSEFVEMPGLELTFPQAMRLWNLGAGDCGSLIDALVDAGFLRWTSRHTVMWTGHDLDARRELMPVHVFVGARRNTATSVGCA